MPGSGGTGCVRPESPGGQLRRPPRPVGIGKPLAEVDRLCLDGQGRHLGEDRRAEALKTFGEERVGGHGGNPTAEPSHNPHTFLIARTRWTHDRLTRETECRYPRDTPSRTPSPPGSSTLMTTTPIALRRHHRHRGLHTRRCRRRRRPLHPGDRRRSGRRRRGRAGRSRTRRTNQRSPPGSRRRRNPRRGAPRRRRRDPPERPPRPWRVP